MIRVFAYTDGAVEDPVTGSFNAGVAQWLIGAGAATEQYVASQEPVLGRAGRLHGSKDKDGEIWIGDSSTTIIDGRVML